MQDPQNITDHSANERLSGLICRDQWLDCANGTVIMGILNVTPDSFYDGGKYTSTSEALSRAEVMLEEGAAIVDVGGASSRPRGSVYGAGAEHVPDESEIKRIIPVIKAIRQSFPEAIISADTFSPTVALRALDAGAHMINDVSGLQNGSASAEYAAEVGAAYVVMHSVRREGSLVHAADYSDVAVAVYESLAESAERAQEAGVKSIVIDPGFGFGKRHRDNLRLIKRLDLLTELRYPVLVGISRKSTVGQILSDNGAPASVHDRLFGSLGIAAAAVLRGAKIIRTHDVRETREMIQGLEAVLHVSS
ncbi:MAG: dihydropteroate synthase [Rhodothermaceae bacterium]|nr:dihydropteroate synthase [Rhodothermaceae bacterium]MYC04973.1 dihydropteroate synthase [Rhodothermaceae bacterium]MYI18031.1 dihydropteroate synthase [Rhodothermaceae bacterium]